MITGLSRTMPMTYSTGVLCRSCAIVFGKGMSRVESIRRKDFSEDTGFLDGSNALKGSQLLSAPRQELGIEFFDQNINSLVCGDYQLTKLLNQRGF